MPKLVVSRDGTLVASRFIESERLVLGRATDCDVRLEDIAVSKHHALIEMLGKDFVLRDLDSANGTKVNGQSVSRHLLHHGDLIQILSYEIRYVDHKSVAGGDGDRTMVINPAEAAAAAPLAQPSQRATPARAVEVRYPKGALKWQTGPRAGEVQTLDRLLARVGAPGAPAAAIFRRPAGFFIAGLEGAATRVNGKAIGPGWQPIGRGDRIKVGADEAELVVESA
jgi:hypothetical protein